MPSRRLLRIPLLLSPGSGKGRDPVIGSGITQLHKIAVQLLDRFTLFAIPLGFTKQPAGQRQFIVVQLGWTLTAGITEFHYPTGQILTNRVAK